MTLQLSHFMMGTLQQGPPIILLHGLLGNKRNWMNIARQLNKLTRRRVYALDLRNHGASPHSPDMSYDVMSQDVRCFLTDNSIRTCSVIEHSMGGRVAMALCLDHSNFVDKMVAVDVSPSRSPNPGIATACIKGMLNLPLDRITSRRQASQFLLEYADDPKMRDFLTTNLVSQDGIWKWRINLEFIANSLNHLTALPDSYLTRKYEKPVLFIGGADSLYLTGQSPHLIQRLFSNSDIRIIPNAGHWVHIDQLKLFLSQVTDFILGNKK